MGDRLAWRVYWSSPGLLAHIRPGGLRRPGIAAQTSLSWSRCPVARFLFTLSISRCAASLALPISILAYAPSLALARAKSFARAGVRTSVGVGVMAACLS